MKSRLRFTLPVVASLLLVAVVMLEVQHLRVTPLPAHPGGKVTNTVKPDYVLLPESEAAAYAKLLSTNRETDVRSWEPTVADIEGLEANLLQIPALSENARGSIRHIDKPKGYFRQYVAVVQRGKKWIFVNAFCGFGMGNSDGWRKHLEIADDGGECYWQAWYDPATQRFSNLMINGVG
jgi:hypothetical protein